MTKEMNIYKESDYLGLLSGGSGVRLGEWGEIQSRYYLPSIFTRALDTLREATPAVRNDAYFPLATRKRGAK